MGSKNVRIAAALVVFALIGVAVYRAVRPAHLGCTVPAQFDAAMGHSQSLHDQAMKAVVQIAQIVPNRELAGWKSTTDFDAGDHGQLAAFICATEDYAKLGLVAGKAGNELWLRHSGTADGADNWTAFIHAVGSTRFARLTVFKRDTVDSQSHPAGHAQWVDGDENIWVSCGKGCCYVTGGGSDTTKTQ